MSLGDSNLAELFGDTAHFAIEAAADPALTNATSVWGQMRIWVNGTRLGRFEEKGCCLYGAQARLEELAAGLDSLWDARLDGLDDADAWFFLWRAIYGDDDRTWEEVDRDALAFCGFVFLTYWGESFDGWNGFAIRPPGEKLRLIARDKESRLISGAVEPAVFVEAVRDFSKWALRETQNRPTIGWSGRDG